MLSNMSIKQKFGMVFVALFVAFILVGVFSFASLRKIDSRIEYTYQNSALLFMSMFEMNQNFNIMTVAAHEMQLANDIEDLEEINQKVRESYTAFLGTAEELKDKLDDAAHKMHAQNAQTLSVDAVPSASSEVHDYSSEIDTILKETERFMAIIPEMKKAAAAGDVDAVAKYDDELMPITDEIMESLAVMVSYAETNIVSVNESIHDTINNSMIIASVIFFILFMVGILIAVIVIGSVTVPISRLLQGAREVAEGNLSVNMRSNRRNEIAVLSNAFAHIVEVVDALISDISEMSNEHKLGEIDNVIDANKYKNSYQTLASELNEMVVNYVNESKIITDAVHHLAIGDLTHDIEKFPGKKAFVTDAVWSLKNKLHRLNGDINTLSEKANMGDLSGRIKESNYEGEWSKLASGLNLFLDRVVEPIAEANAVLSEQAKGNLAVSVSGDYKGEFLKLKNSINSSSATIHSYISEIAHVLSELENNDLNQEIKREYLGDFNIIKNALNSIFIKFNNFMGETGNASNHVGNDAVQVLQTSVVLSNGSSTQAEAVNELTGIVSNINQIAKENENKSKQADDLIKEATKNADTGSSEMTELLSAMKDIRDSSDNISKIIKTIEDIAFQTNLLALNASVESARAGVHGKGFSVVATEVKNLASKCALSAKESVELIIDSNSRVSQGEKIAASTAEALKTIVENINQVSLLVSQITVTSSEQSAALTEINDKLLQINDVVQNTSSTAEETASLATKLSTQSQKLNDMLSVFNLTDFRN